MIQNNRVFRNIAGPILALVLLLLISNASMAQSMQTPPDPSKPQTTTPSKSGTTMDRETTQKIHKALVADKSLSKEARKIRIVTMNGNVTLRGTVRSDEEKTTIENKAKEIAGETRVTNDLEVRPKHQ